MFAAHVGAQVGRVISWEAVTVTVKASPREPTQSPTSVAVAEGRQEQDYNAATAPQPRLPPSSECVSGARACTGFLRELEGLKTSVIRDQAEAQRMRNQIAPSTASWARHSLP